MKYHVAFRNPTSTRKGGNVNARSNKKAVILILLVSLALLVTVPQALAATGYKIEGNANGLTIESQPNEQGTGNLNPGDEKASRLKLTNTNDDDVRVWIRTNITERRIPEGSRDLSEVLHLLIKGGSRVITDDSFDGAADAGNIEIGTMDPGEEIILDFTVTLPGPGTGNDYQGSSIDANWTFTTESESSGGGGGGGGRRTPSNPVSPRPSSRKSLFLKAWGNTRGYPVCCSGS